MSEVKFEREGRYIVVKRADLEKIPNQKVVHSFLASLAEVSAHSCRIPQRNFLVIESDWPEYKPAWRMIERRMTGQPADDFDAQRLRADTAEAALIEKREEFNKLGDRYDAAEQRIAALVGLLREASRYIPGHGPGSVTGELLIAISAALNPNPEVESQ